MNRANIADLRAHLSQYLRAVRRGERVIVLDRSTPVAVIIPYEEWARVSVRPPRIALHSVQLPRRPIGKTDPVETLLAERRKGRR